MYLVAGPSPGGLGFLVVVVFFVAAVLIFLAMTRSMRRMRAHVDRGDFGAENRPADSDGPNDAGEPPTPPSGA